MRAIQIRSTGGPEVLELVEMPMPVAAAGQVLVKIAACGVNFIDTYLREGRYPVPLPFIQGRRRRGRSSRWVRVCVGLLLVIEWPGNGTRGTYAEYAVAPAAELLKVPEAMSLEDAAAVLLQGLTAHYLAHDTYKIQTGDTVLFMPGPVGWGCC